MTKNKTHVPVEIDLSEVEFDTIQVAADGQTVEQFMQETAAARRPVVRTVTVPRDAVPGFPFFKPVGQGAM